MIVQLSVDVSTSLLSMELLEVTILSVSKTWPASDSRACHTTRSCTWLNCAEEATSEGEECQRARTCHTVVLLAWFFSTLWLLVRPFLLWRCQTVIIDGITVLQSPQSIPLSSQVPSPSRPQNWMARVKEVIRCPSRSIDGVDTLCQCRNLHFASASFAPKCLL